MLRRVMLWGLALGVAYVVISNAPDMVRYMRIRAM